MGSRHLARSIAMQTLFEWDFYDYDEKKADKFLELNLKEFGPDLDNQNLTKNLVKGVIEKKDILDKIIEKTAPEWPISQIARIDRTVLRLGLYELLFADRGETPPKVAINEAIELAKNFGSDSSGKFVNGVLGTVYREMGEPGKYDEKKTREKLKDISDLSKLPVEKLGGGVVYRKDKKELFFALVHDVFGYWTLSKGHLEEGEKVEEGTARELKEELGVQNFKLKEIIGENEYFASDPEKGLVRRQVTYFLAETSDKELALHTSGGLDDAKWFKREELSELKIYDDVRKIIDKGIELIKSKK